jgi:hypothetical protein
MAGCVIFGAVRHAVARVGSRHAASCTSTDPPPVASPVPPLQDAKVPFMVTFGNHDCEEDGKYNAIRNFTCRCVRVG